MQTAQGTKNREDIAVALFNKLKAATGVTNSTRRLKHWNDVPETEMPYLCLAQNAQRTEVPTTRGLPYKWTWLFKVYIYTNAGQDENATPSTQMNSLLDAIETAIAQRTLVAGQQLASFERQTLEGLVHDCRIVGEVETDEGTLGAISVAIVPIEVLA